MTRTLFCRGTAILLLLVFSGICSGQTFSKGGMSADDVAKYLSELDARSKVLPSDPTLIYMQISWVDRELSQMDRLKQRAEETANEMEQELDSFKQRWKRANSAIGDIASEGTIATSELSSAMGSLCRCLNELSSWGGIRYQDCFANADQILESPLVAQLVAGERPIGSKWAELVKLLRGQELSQNMQSLTEYMEKHREAMARETKQLCDNLAKVEEGLAEYKEKLHEAQRDMKVKSSLAGALPWVVLALGLLCVGVILATRLFPENVMLEWAASGQVIQLVSVLLLLTAIMALGLAGLLTERTIGTLLGGVGGYVLSQGVGRIAARRAKQSEE